MRTALYRWFDSGGRLLYVGISLDVLGRTRTHAARQPWWGQIASATVTWYDDRKQALKAETAAIGAEGPQYNGRPSGQVAVSWRETVGQLRLEAFLRLAEQMDWIHLPGSRYAEISPRRVAQTINYDLDTIRVLLMPRGRRRTPAEFARRILALHERVYGTPAALSEYFEQEEEAHAS